MDFTIISKQDVIPEFNTKAIKIKYIEYYSFGGIYHEEKITESLISKILSEIHEGIDIYISLNPDGETDWMEVNSDGQWLSIGYCSKDEYYYCCYNSDFEYSIDLIDKADFNNEDIFAPIFSGGQSPIPKINTIKDMDIGVKTVEYFIRTGEIYPGIDWMKQLY